MTYSLNFTQYSKKTAESILNYLTLNPRADIEEAVKKAAAGCFGFFACLCPWKKARNLSIKLNIESTSYNLQRLVQDKPELLQNPHYVTQVLEKYKQLSDKVIEIINDAKTSEERKDKYNLLKKVNASAFYCFLYSFNSIKPSYTEQEAISVLAAYLNRANVFILLLKCAYEHNIILAKSCFAYIKAKNLKADLKNMIEANSRANINNQWHNSFLLLQTACLASHLR